MQVLKRPLITEKSNELREQSGKYTFEVDPKANKIQIKQAVQRRFNVDVLNVSTIRVKGKRKTQMTRKGYFQGQRPLRKKAIVTLKPGQSIDIFDSGAGE